jgi:hypothetical protein
MKKLITLLLLFTITLFYSIPTQAYTLDGNDIPLVQKKNLFDKDTAISGFFIANDGSITADAFNFYHPDFIPVEAGQTITTSNATATAHRIVWYNDSQVFISRDVVSSATSLTATAPANTKFFRVSGLLSQINTFQSERGSTATSYTSYGFLTLNDIFLDGNIVLNSTFDNNSSSGYILSAQHTIVDNRLNLNKAVFGLGRYNTVLPINSQYYVNALFSNNGLSAKGVNLVIGTSDGSSYIAGTLNPDNTLIGIIHSNIITTNSTANVFLNFFRGDTSSGIGFVDNIILLNLNSLGINHLSKTTLDHYFREWELNNAYIEGYDDGYNVGFDEGFDDGYDEGFDDGVASDTSYAVGYSLGLSEGEDMETG